MDENCPNPGAYGAVMHRAAHQLLDVPRILEDPIALQIIGHKGKSDLYSNIDHYQTQEARYLRAFIAMRSRYAEDLLALSIQNGISQYIILGAGLDTFSYRNSYLKSTIHVVEVDHPIMQTWKVQRLRSSGIPIPKLLKYVPANFETTRLRDALTVKEFDPYSPAFFSWLGVTQYLSRNAVIEILKFVSSMPQNTEIVFEYIVNPSLLNSNQQKDLIDTAKRSSIRGEPWKTFFEPLVLAKELYEIGFRQIEDFGPTEANDRYFKNRTDGLFVGGAAHIMRARV